MKIKDIIITALRFIGRDEIAEKLILLSEPKPENPGAGETEGSGADTSSTENEPGTEEGGAEDENAVTEEENDVIKTLLYCFNSVEDELARLYFPMEFKEVMSSETGEYPFEEFGRRPVKIISVTSEGKPVDFTVNATSLIAHSENVTITYNYAPLIRDIEGESAFSPVTANERLVAAGTASEYCLINGEAELAKTWESVYRGEIERLQNLKFAGKRLPPRRWL